MEGYRLIEIGESLIEIGEEFEDEEFEEEEEDEEEEEEEDEEDYDEEEHEEDLIPEGIILPTDLDIFNTGELEDDDDDFDDDEGDEEDAEYYEEEEDLIPVERMLPRDSIEDDDYEDEDEDEEYYEEEEADDLIPVEMTSPRVSSSIFHGRPSQGAMVINNGLLENSNDSESCEGKPRNQENSGREIDGLICPICFEAWTSGGEHQICCLPCGHIYGLSCIKKWLQQTRGCGKCPQCNNLCTLKDVRVLYASRLCVTDEELHKRVRSLEAKCAYLEQKAAPLTPDELIDQICSNPALVQRLATVLAELHQQQGFP